MRARRVRAARLEEKVGDLGVSKVVWDIIIVLVIVSIGGFFAAAEMALVSLREGQVRALAKRGKRGQKAARLAQDPNRFFSAVQIGVTLATLVSGAYGAATLADSGKSWLERQHVSAAGPGRCLRLRDVCITFVSLVLGELSPKRIALQRSTRMALLAAPTAGPDSHAGPARGVAAVRVDERGGRRPRRRPPDGPAGDDRAGAARPGGRRAGAQPGRAAHRRGGVRRGQAADPRGAGAAHGGGLPRRRDPGERGRQDRRGGAVLAAAGLPGLLRQRDRLRARPRPARARRANGPGPVGRVSGR